MNKREEGLRFNEGKLRYDLVHQWAHEQMVKVLTKGSEKYSERNWEKGMPWSKVLASLERHLSAIKQGEDYDKETGELHVAHVACNAHFLTAYYKIHPFGDDRPHQYLKDIKIGLDIDEVLCAWTKGWCEKYNKTQPLNWHFCYDIKHDFEKMIENREIEDFYLNLEPLITNEELPFEPHCYITSRSIDTSITEKWLQKNNFPTTKVYSVGFNESKVDVAKESGIDIFVDDKYDNFVELNKNGIFTLLMDAPHNQRYDVGYKRIYSLKELKRFINN